MVAKNPLFSGRWTAKKFGATVIDDIWPEVIFFTLVATMVVLVSEKTSANLGVSNQLLTVLGLVLGLVISFRTSSAYERYQDGRKMWTNIIVGSRNLAQMIWIHVPTDRVAGKDSKETPLTPLQVIIEKKTMVNLVQAFSVSVKHLLRGEQGVYYDDLYPLIAFLPRYANDSPGKENDEAEKLPLWHLRDGHQHVVDNASQAQSVVIPEAEPKAEGAHLREDTLVEGKTDFASKPSRSSSTTAHGRTTEMFKRLPRTDTLFDPEDALPHIESEYKLSPARSPPEMTIYDIVPLLRLFRWMWRVVTLQKFWSKNEPAGKRVRRRKAYTDTVESHVPLEISLVLSNYAAWLMAHGLLTPAIATGIMNNLNLLQDTVSNLERICNTPLPFAYQAHLRMSLWIYLILLPFQIYSAYGVITIPATAFSSFLLLGFLEIGQEIENPFNYDLNDLDIDYFCLEIQRDLHEITAHTNPDPHDFLFNKWNQPFAPSDRRNAEDLTSNNDKEYTSPQGGSEPGIGSIRKTLVAGWKEIDHATRNR